MQSSRNTKNLVYVLLIILLVAAVHYSWIGYLGSDDVAWYHQGARGWLDQYPYVGGHGTIRNLLTVPTAISIYFLGDTQFSLLLPSMLYAAALIVMLTYWLQRICTPLEIFFCIAAVITLPIVVQHFSIANIDLVETFFVLAGVLLFLDATERGASFGRIFAAGLCLGAAFMCRETAMFVAWAFIILFLFGFGVPRKWYFVLGAGFIAINLVQSVYLGFMTGDPFYRYNLIEGADPYLDRSVNLEGNVRVHPLIDPLLVILFNQEFALVYWLGLPSTFLLLTRVGLQGLARRTVLLFGVIAVVWVLGVSLLSRELVLNTRYFLTPALLLSVPIGWMIAILWQRRHRSKSAILALLLFGGNFAGMAVENKDFMFGERQLVEITARYSGEVIRTDEQSFNRAYMLVYWAGRLPQVLPDRPRQGGLFFENRMRHAEYPADMIATCFKDRALWQEIGSGLPERRFPFNLMAAIGMDKYLPASLRARLMERHPGYTLFRVTTPVDDSCDLGRRYVLTRNGYVRAPVRNKAK